MYSTEANNALKVDRGANFMLKLSRKVLLNEIDRKMKCNFADFFNKKLEPTMNEKREGIDSFEKVKLEIKDLELNHGIVRLDYQEILDFFDIPALLEIARFVADSLNPGNSQTKSTQVLDEMVTCLKGSEVFTIRTFLYALSFLWTIRSQEICQWSDHKVRTEEFEKIRNIFREVIIFFTKFRDSNNNNRKEKKA
jgi:hypothetical protein